MALGSALPTYATAADLLERKNGSGARLVGWTIARAALISMGMLAVGVKPRHAVMGSLLSSGAISVLTYYRIKHAGSP